MILLNLKNIEEDKLDYSKAKVILKGIASSSLEDLTMNLYKSATRYARIRTDWYFLDAVNRLSSDSSRTMAHNAFIDDCNILSRNMVKIEEDINWRSELGNDRKIIGDFACFLHCILALIPGRVYQ